MTEQEWLECADPTPMLEFLRDYRKASGRKLRLFSLACCRRIWPSLTDERTRKAVEVAELHADGKANMEELSAAANECGLVGGCWPEHYAKAGSSVSLWLAAKAVQFATLLRTDPETDNVAWAAAASAATEGIGWSDPLWDKTLRSAYTSAGHAVEDEAHWAEICWSGAPFALRHNSFVNFSAWHTERKEQAAILREEFGNPFHELPKTNLSWYALNNSSIPKLAQVIYDYRHFTDMPILADALAEAGCDNADLLAHCRSEGAHVRGCWLLDLLLGKE
jgi:hypothetical protein